jgi:hypothetical protein
MQQIAGFSLESLKQGNKPIVSKSIQWKSAILQISTALVVSTFNPLISYGEISSSTVEVVQLTEQVQSTQKDYPYEFAVTNDLILSPKPVKTHQYEVLYQSQQYKGFNVGLTVRR